MMKNMFEKVTCTSCQKQFDKMLDECPKCKTKNPHFDQNISNDKLFWLVPLRQVLLFIIVWVGITLFAALSQIVYLLIKQAMYPDIDPKALSSTLDVLMFPNLIAYLIVITIIGVIIFPFLNKFLKQFTNYKSYLFGLVFAVALLGFSIVWGNLSSILYTLITNEAPTGGNSNQIVLEELISYYPVLGVILFGIIGPIVEEFGYRVGLFNFLNRTNKIIAYCACGLIFGLIHFTIPSTTNGWINEFLQLPSYIIAGLLLCFAYEKYGLPACITVHIINYLVGVIVVLI